MPGCYYDLRISVDAHTVRLANSTDPQIVLASADLEAIRLDSESWRRLCGAVVEAVSLRLAEGDS